jgi:hypothetical protein
MREFFKGWKRKLGCVTLVMACVLMTGWIRSQTNNDEFRFRSVNGRHCWLTSFAGRIGWRQLRGDPDTPVYRLLSFHTWRQDDDSVDGVDIPWRVLGVRCTFDRYGFRYGEGTTVYAGVQLNTRFWQVPYWSIVPPLAVLSAWLLFSRPRTTTKHPAPTDPTEPDHA